jgi:hypothetical protein
VVDEGLVVGEHVEEVVDLLARSWDGDGDDYRLHAE